MNFPIEDVVKNVRHFLVSVKKATGNMKDDSDRSRPKTTGPKPGACHSHAMMFAVLTFRQLHRSRGLFLALDKVLESALLIFREWRIHYMH